MCWNFHSLSLLLAGLAMSWAAHGQGWAGHCLAWPRAGGSIRWAINSLVWSWTGVAVCGVIHMLCLAVLSTGWHGHGLCSQRPALGTR
jgi:hypothetical protein